MSRATSAQRKKHRREPAGPAEIFRIGGAIGSVRPGDAPWFRLAAGDVRVALRSATPLVWLTANDVLATSAAQPRSIASTAELAEGLAKLRHEVAEAREKLDAVLRPREVELRDLPRDQAREEVHDYFIDHGRSYPSDAARALRLDPLIVLELCDELEREGLIGD